MSRQGFPAQCYVREDLAGQLTPATILDWGVGVSGQTVREVTGRRTLRIDLDGRTFYLKLHTGIGLKELFKNWLSFRQPVFGARNEFKACRYLESCGIRAPIVAAFAQSRGPAWRRRSLVMCDELSGFEDLETLSLRWSAEPPDGREVRALVMQVALFARAFHDAGLVHRDFYICHLLRDSNHPESPLAVLDLHRARQFAELPARWRLRDLAALQFSVLDLPISRLAWLRFVRVYTGQPLRRTFAENGKFWRAVHQRAGRLHAKARRKGLRPGAG
jgi:heptose I phosphotransferase